MKITYGSSKGNVRNKDEDSIAVLEIKTSYEGKTDEKALLVLADGVGGQPEGEMASYLAVKNISAYLLPELMSKQEITPLASITAALRDSGKRIMEYSLRHPEYKGMASTAACAVIMGGKAYCGNVGDSNVYVINAGGVERLSEEHRDTAGMMTAALGYTPDVDCAIASKRLGKGDIILICCDGLTDSLGLSEIKKEVLSAKSLPAACKSLLKKAEEAGGMDNISLILAGGMI